MGVLSSLVEGAFSLGASALQNKANIEVANTQADAQVQAAKIQADTAQKQIDAQLQANREQQDFQKSESELAFSRNSSKGQLAQLIDAGLSEQQARQIIAGGATGSYTPTAGVNQMQGVDYNTLGSAEASAVLAEGNRAAGIAASRGQMAANMMQSTGQMLSGVGSSILESFADPSGGTLGAAFGNGLLEDISKNIDLIDQSQVHNFVDFKKWCKSLDPKSPSGKIFANSSFLNKLDRVSEFAPAMRFFNNNLNQVYTANLDSNQQYKRGLEDIKLTQVEQLLNDASAEYQRQASEEMKARIGLDEAQISELEQRARVESEQTNILLQQHLSLSMQNEIAANSLPQIKKANLWQFKAMEAACIKEWKVNKDPQVISSYINMLIQTQEGAAYAAALQGCIDKGTREAFTYNPTLSAAVYTYNMFASCGADQLLQSTLNNSSSIIKSSLSHGVTITPTTVIKP